MNLSKRALAISITAVSGVTAIGIYSLISSADAPQQPVVAPVTTPVDVAPILAKDVTEWDELFGHIEAV